jgi:quercetin dioxygenase-like cupin family protein
MAEQTTRAISRTAGEGVRLRNPTGGALTLLLRGQDTGGALTVFESTSAPGEGPPLHTHAREDELIYVLEGALRCRFEDELHDVPAGGCAYIPCGLVHTWQNAGDVPARILVLFTPAAAGMEAFFERFSRLPDDVPAPEGFRALAADAGMDVVGPPLAQSHPA